MFSAPAQIKKVSESIINYFKLILKNISRCCFLFFTFFFLVQTIFSIVKKIILDFDILVYYVYILKLNISNRVSI